MDGAAEAPGSRSSGDPCLLPTEIDSIVRGSPTGVDLTLLLMDQHPVALTLLHHGLA